MKSTVLINLFYSIFLSGIMEAKNPHFVNVEFLGAHNLVGLSFDSRFSEDSKYGFKIGVGYGYEDSQSSMGFNIEFGGENAKFRTSPVGYVRGRLLKHAISAPISIYRLYGEKRHFFELGIGVVPYYAEYKYNTELLIDPTMIKFVEHKTEDDYRYYGLLQTAYRYEGDKILVSAGLDIPINTPGADFRQFIGLYPRLSIGYKL